MLYPLLILVNSTKANENAAKFIQETHIYKNIYILYIYVFIHTYIYVYVCAYIYVYIYIYGYMIVDMAIERENVESSSQKVSYYLVFVFD